MSIEITEYRAADYLGPFSTVNATTYARRDSNPRYPVCGTGALAAEPRAHVLVVLDVGLLRMEQDHEPFQVSFGIPKVNDGPAVRFQLTTDPYGCCREDLHGPVLYMVNRYLLHVPHAGIEPTQPIYKDGVPNQGMGQGRPTMSL
jgi:hypothetical protein